MKSKKKDLMLDIPRSFSGHFLPQTRGHWWRIINAAGLKIRPPDVLTVWDIFPVRLEGYH